MVSAHTLVNKWICYILMGLINTSPIGFQSWVFRGPIPQVRVLKAGMQMWVTNPLLLRKKLGVGGSLLIIWCCVRDGIYGKCVSAFATHFDGGILSFPQCIGVAQLVSGSLSEGIALCAAVHSMCLWGQESSGASYVTILVLPLSFSIILAISSVN